MLVELKMRRKSPWMTGNSPIDGIRILALLPGEWLKDLAHATGEIVIRIHAKDVTSSAEIRAEVVRILADPTVGHWEIVSCDSLANGIRSKGLNQWLSP
jgi:hypothetical protein